MANFLKKIFRFTSLFKVLTIICLCCLLLAYMCPYIHPSTFWILPFFGLAYPVILVCTILLLVIWMFARSKWAIFTAVILVLGGKIHFRMIALGSEPDVMPLKEECLHVLSYNVRLFDLYNSEPEERYTNRDSIFHYLERENPDVVCFQEFYQQDEPTDFETKKHLLRVLKIKDYHERYSHKLTGRQNFGIAMLSRYPMISKGDVVIENADDDNYCIYADIVKNSDTFRVYNVHLRSIKFEEEEYAAFGQNELNSEKQTSAIKKIINKLRIAFPKRADQALTVITHMETSPYPVIICGDFNDTPMSYSYNQFNRRLVDAYRNCRKGIGTTYAGKVPAGRIDYIFYSPELKSANFQIQKEIYSDHRAISCFVYK